jgi:hypothetical protein
VFFWTARLAASPLCGETGFMRAVHPGMIVIMRTSLHQRASNTYYGQWMLEKTAISGPRIAVHCP